MKLDELAAQCVAAMNIRTALGLSMEDAQVLITTPAGWKAPARFPRSEIVQVKEDGTRVRYLPAMRTLAWLVGVAGVAMPNIVTVPAVSPKSYPRHFENMRFDEAKGTYLPEHD